MTFNKYKELLRVVFFTLSLLGACLIALAIFAYYVKSIFYDENSWIIEVYKQHFLATFGLPFAAIAAVFLIILFKHSEGPIKFKAIGLEFEGASGEIIMWVIVFVAEVLCLKLVW